MNTKMILAVLAAALIACCSYCCYSQNKTRDDLTTRVDLIESATVQTVGWINGFIKQSQPATATDTDTNNTTKETE